MCRTKAKSVLLEGASFPYGENRSSDICKGLADHFAENGGFATIASNFISLCWDVQGCHRFLNDSKFYNLYQAFLLIQVTLQKKKTAKIVTYDSMMEKNRENCENNFRIN